MSDRLKPFTTEELSALVFSLDIAETVQRLVPEAERIRQEMIDELQARCPESRRNSKIEPAHSHGLVLL